MTDRDGVERDGPRILRCTGPNWAEGCVPVPSWSGVACAGAAGPARGERHVRTSSCGGVTWDGLGGTRRVIYAIPRSPDSIT